MNDSELLSLLTEAPEHGLQVLSDEYFSLIRVIVRSKVGRVGRREDIEECVSSVLFEIYRNRGRIDLTRGSIRAYVSVCAKRVAIDAYHRLMRQQGWIAQDEKTEEHPDTAPTGEELALERQEREAVLTAVSALGKPDSEIIFRTYYLGQKPGEIARDLSMSRAAVYKRISRALEKLRGALKEVLI